MLIYNDLVRRIVEDVAAKVPDFRHIDPGRIALLTAPRSSGHPTGNLATTYGLRQNSTPTFSIWTRGGSRSVFAVTRWFRYVPPRIRLGGREMLYLVLLRLPRLLLQNPLPIIIHELYHIAEGFDGGMRPVNHGAFFDREVRRLTRAWLERQKGDLARVAQLRHHELEREFGAVLARALPPRFTLPLVEPVDKSDSHDKAVPRLYPGYQLAGQYSIRDVLFTPDEVPRVIADKDLVLRHYSRRGCERVAPAYARYGQSSSGLTA